MLEHEKAVGKDVKLSGEEPSSAQVRKPIYLDSLTSWYQSWPKDVRSKENKLAPMLKTLNYTYSNEKTMSEFYGKPDKEVVEKLKASNFTHEWREGVDMTFRRESSLRNITR